MSKLNLDDFIAKAELTNEKIALESIQGGSLFDCHGDWGQRGKVIGKKLVEVADKIIDKAIERMIQKM
jgi:hypothetical protein